MAGIAVELATRVILNTKAAFGKLQLHRKELITGTREGIEEIVKTIDHWWTVRTGQLGAEIRPGREGTEGR